MRGGGVEELYMKRGFFGFQRYSANDLLIRVLEYLRKKYSD